MFVGEIRKVSNQQVAAIGGKVHHPSVVVTVKWIWREDSGKLHEYLVEDVFFFTISNQHYERNLFRTTVE